MKLSHWSKEPLLKENIERREQPHSTGYAFKPFGTWVSVDGEFDWEQWCLSEQPDWIDGTYRHEVILEENANILIIDTVDALDAFAKEYAPYGVPEELSEYSQAGHHTQYEMDWRRLAQDADGIIIAPYQWERRLGSYLWYYSWDCASGCIWNPDVIKEVSAGQYYRVANKQLAGGL